jgi:hypothetical protein
MDAEGATGAGHAGLLTSGFRSWRLGVEAYCTDDSPVTPPESGLGRLLKGVQVVTATGSRSTERARTVEANCPAGKAVIGGGGGREGPARIVMTELRRANVSPGGGGSFRASVRAVAFADEPWAPVASAVCADVRTPTSPDARDYVQVLVSPVATTGLGSWAAVTKSATCLSTHVVVGGGARAVTLVGGRYPAPAPPEVVLSSSQPFTQPVQGWSASAVEARPTNAQWALVVRAVCAQIGRPQYIPGS